MRVTATAETIDHLAVLFYLFSAQTEKPSIPLEKSRFKGSRDGAVVRALASHQCGPGSTPVPGVICGLSLLLVLVLAPRAGFSPGTPVFSSSKFQLDLKRA